MFFAPFFGFARQQLKNVILSDAYTVCLKIFRNLLKTFYATTRFKPERIVMYRDGVSDSQFLEVLVSELKAMRGACSELDKDYQPAITFLVVQKRHHTR